MGWQRCFEPAAIVCECCGSRWILHGRPGVHFKYADINSQSIIPVLPSIVNAALITTVVSGGNAFAFNASRSLHALALEGQAPAFLRRTNSKYVKQFIYFLRVNNRWPLIASVTQRSSIPDCHRRHVTWLSGLPRVGLR